MTKTWGSDYNTGIAEIDAGNRNIASYINSLSEAKETGDKHELDVVITHLLEHVCNQFLLEEAMMKQVDYEYRVGHEKVHELFAKKVADFRGRINEGEAPYGDLITMLDRWLETHVRNEDRLYASTVQLKIEQEGGESWVRGLMKNLFA